MKRTQDVGAPIVSHTVLITLPLKQQLRERAFADGRSQSEIVRQVLSDYLNRWPETK
jgi:hypothetical protein